MRDLLQTMWLRLFILAAGRMGFRFIFPYEKELVLSSMRDYIEEHEAEAKQRKDKALNLNS